MPECQVIEVEAGLGGLTEDWWRLWRVAAAPPFLCPGWLLPWWRVLRPGALRVIAVREAGRLVALAPLYLERGRLWPVGMALSDYLDVLIDPASRQAPAALTGCLEAMSDWQECSLEELAPQTAALRLAAGAGLTLVRTEARPCPSWDAPGLHLVSGAGGAA